MVYRCHLAPLSATIHTIQATHSQHHTLLNSYKMVRSTPLRSYLLQYRRLMVLLLQALCPAHCYHAVQSAHKSLRVPPVMAAGDVMPLAEAITQLSFLRCGVSIAPPQPSQPTSAHITSGCCCADDSTLWRLSGDVTPQTSDQQDTLSCDVAVQTSFYGAHTLSLDAAVQTIPHITPSQHVSTQMGSRSASSFSVDMFVQTPVRSTVLHDVATTTAHGVLHWLYLLERSSGPPKLCSSVPAINARSTCLAAAAARTRTASPAS